MIPEPQRTYVLELLNALGPAAEDFVVADAQAMKFVVEKARATKDIDFLLNVLALRQEPLQLAALPRHEGHLLFMRGSPPRLLESKGQIHKKEISAMQKTERKPLFDLGQLVATPGVLAALEKTVQTPKEFLSRHVTGDWGDIPEEDRKENQYSLEHGFRLLSSYRTTAGDAVWVITEANRSRTIM